MVLNDIRRHVREVCGNEDQNVLVDYRIDTSIDRAMNWLAVKLKFEKRIEEQTIALVAGQTTYKMPVDLGYVIWIEWGNPANRLTPKSTYEWDRDSINYRHATSGNPQQFAIQTRSLVLLPPPDAGAVTQDPFLHYRAVFAAPQMGAGGDAHLSELDAHLLVYQAALELMAIRPSDENTQRIQFCQKRIDELLLDAMQRATNPLLEYFPGWRPFSSRLGGAR